MSARTARPRRLSLVVPFALAFALALALAGTPAVAAPAAGGPNPTSVAPTGVPRSADRAMTPTSVGVIDIAAGAQHTCAVRGGGSLECWGDNGDGRATPPPGSYYRVAAGNNFSCAIGNDGDTADGGPLTCWGANSAGQATPPSGSDYIQIGAAGYNACARDVDWNLTCWGTSGFVEDDPVYDFSVAASHLCALTSGGVMACQGFDFYGQVSAPNAAGGTWADVSTGASWTCAIRESADAADGTIQCWGQSDGDALNAPSGTFRSLASSGFLFASCAIGLLPSTMSCWGVSASTPTGNFQKVVAGTVSFCGIDNSSMAVCWGFNTNGNVSPITTGSAMTAGAAGVAYDEPLPISHISPAPSYTVTGDLPDGVTVSGGRVVGTPMEAGSFEFTVSSTGSATGIEATFTLEVAPGELASLVVTPSSTTANTDDAITVTVTGYDAGGNSLGDVTGSATITSSVSSDTVTGGDVTFTFDPAAAVTNEVVHTLTATVGAISGTAEVTVSPLVVGIELTLDPGTLVVFGVSVASVTGLDSGGDEVADLTAYATITSSVGTDTVSGDEITTSSLGSRTITAAYGALSDTAGLTATAGPLASVVVTPSASTAATDDAVTLSVEGFDSFGNSLGDVTPSATITSSVAGDTVSGATVKFAFDPAAGATTDVTHTLTATIGAVHGSTTVTVSPLVTDLTLTLSSTTAHVGDTVTVTVEGLDENGDPVGDLSNHVVVTSDQAGDVVSGSTVTFTHASPHVITVDYGTLTASQTVEVSPRPSTGLASTGSIVALAPGGAALALLLLGGALVVARIRRAN